MIKNEDGDVVVAVHLNGQWRWFHSDMDLWFLDYPAWGTAFGESEPEAIHEQDPRHGFPILDQNNAAQFLDRIAAEEVDAELLQEALKERLPTDDWWEVADLYPCLLVDFDRKIFRSMYSEPSGIEDFAPDGWDSARGEFIHLIPESEHYWIIDGKDIFQAIIDQTD